MHKTEFKKLYDYCQTLTPKVSRKSIQDKIYEIFPSRKFRVIMSDLDVSVTRGYFLSAKNVEHPFVKQNGRDVIVLAKGLNKCWERFVCTKEMMHMFDDDGDFTETPDQFENLLLDFESTTDKPSDQTISDIKGFWMAMACLCPEKNRQEFIDLKSKNHIDNFAIASQLKIPEQYVPKLFQTNYLHIIDSLLP